MHKYKLLGRKGEGTFSEVLKAQSIKSGKYMAIKCMKHVFESIEQVNNLREIQALRRLSPHPNIVKLYEVLYDQPTGRLALVFELMDMNIYELIKGRTHYLPEETIKNYSYQILKAVDHMHRHGIFHRDIKPENLLIAENTLKLADFGSCRGIYSKQPYTEYISTRWYRAPECLLTDGYYGYKMDLWGVGCVLFETLALYPLFPGTNEADQIERIHKILGTPTAEVFDKFKKFGSSHVDFNFTQHKRHPMGLSKLLPHVSAEVVDLLQRMLIYDPDERITARDALRHPWFSELRAADRKAKEAAKLKKAAEEAANGASGSGSGRPTPSPGLDGSQASPDRTHGLSPSNDSTHESTEPKKLPDSFLAAAQGQSSNAMGLPAPKGTLVQQGKQGGSTKVSAADSVGTGHQSSEQGTGGTGGRTGGHGPGRAAGAEVVSSKGGSGAGAQAGKEKSKRDPWAGYQIQGSRLIAGKEKEGEQSAGNAPSQPQGGKFAETKSGKGVQGEKSSTFSSPVAAAGRSSGAGAASAAPEGSSKLNAGNSMYSLPNNGSTMAGGASGAVLSPYAGASGVGGPSVAGSGGKGMKYAPASSLVAAAKNELSQSSVYGGTVAMQGMYSPHASMMAGTGQAQAQAGQGQGQGQGLAGSPLPQGSPSTLQVLAGLASGTKAAAGGPRRLDPIGAASVAGSSPSLLGSYGGGMSGGATSVGAAAGGQQQPALYSLSNGPAGRSNGQTTVVLSQPRQGAGATRLPASMLMPPSMPGHMPVMQALSPAGSGSSMPGPASSPVQQQQQAAAYNNPYANYSTGLLNSGKKGGVLSPLGMGPTGQGSGAPGGAVAGQGGMAGRYQGGVAAGTSLYGSTSVPGLSDSSLMPGISSNSPSQPIPSKSKGGGQGGPVSSDTSGNKQQQAGGAFSIEQPTKAGGHLGAAMAKQQVQAARGEGVSSRAAPAPQAAGQRQGGGAGLGTGKQKAGMASDFYISGMTSKSGKQSSAMLSPGGGVPSGPPLWSSPIQQQGQGQGGLGQGYGSQHGAAAAAAAAGRGLVAGMSPAVAGAVARNLAGSPVGMGGWSDPVRSPAQAQAQALGGRGMLLAPLGGGPSRAPLQSMPSYGSPAGNIGPHALYTNGAAGGNAAGGLSSLYHSGPAVGPGQGGGAARAGLAGAGSLAGNLLLAGGVQSGPAAAYGSPANPNFRWGNRDRSTRRLGGGAGGGPSAVLSPGAQGAQQAGGQGGAGRRGSSDKGIPTKAELQQYQSPYAQKSSLGY